MTRFALLPVLLAGCWTSSAQPTAKLPVETDVRVALAAVTLGDDCGDDPVLKPPAKTANKPAGPAEAPAAGAPMPCKPGANCGRWQRSCDQTSMQLSLRASAGDAPTKIQVKLVELLDSRGKVLAELDSRMPSKWTGSDYVEWDEVIGPTKTLAASYLLSAPDWNKLTGSRWNAHSKTFQLRVTLAVGTQDRTVEKQSIVPAMLEPPVPT